MKKYNVTKLFLGTRVHVILFLFLLLTSCSSKERSIKIFSEINTPMLQFAINDLKKSLGDWESTDITDADIAIVNASSDEFIAEKEELLNQLKFDLESEGFSIFKDQDEKIWVIGADEAGIMYGVLELAEQIELYGLDDIEETNQNPYMPTRGVKFNIPLDVRTPTYTDPSETCQHNIPEMWSIDFWTEYIDDLARYRYNMISLWSLHPFPSMIKVPEYPNIALNDVYRTTKPIERFYEIGNGEHYPEILKNTELVKKMTIEEKIDFWQEVMRYAKERNIEFYLMNWNIFDFGIDGKYGITESPYNPVTKDYFRKSVKQMLITYPDLGGIGLTVGENMAEYSSEVKEKWAFDSYGQGVLDAAKIFPDRKITFIHRLHQGQVQDITDQFNPLIENKNINFIFSYKYAKAHIMSSTKQPFADEYVKEIKGMKTIWTLRNDDNFYFRWGAPRFLREFIKNIPYDVSEGFYYGSDGYVWGREFLSKNPKTPRELEIEKHWYHWMTFGRLGYNPDLPEKRFVDIIQNHFQEVDGKILFEGWQEASMIYPVTTGFHWGPADFSWYIEGCISHPAGSIDRSGLHNVEQFIKQEVHEGTNNQSITDYVEMLMKGEISELTSPLDISEQLHNHADKALDMINSLDQVKNEELSNTLEDIRSISYLGKYYAHKINGATYLALYRKSKNKEHQKISIEQLEMTLDFWKKYAENAMEQYINPIRMKRVGLVDWVKFTNHVKNDIDIARND